MARIIKVYTFGRNGMEMKEVNIAEAERIIKEIYADPYGGIIADRKTGEVISEIGPDVEELSILHLMGGG